MARGRKAVDETEKIVAGGYTLEATTKSYYLGGHDALEGIGFWFMYQELSLLGISIDANPIHNMAREIACEIS